MLQLTIEMQRSSLPAARAFAVYYALLLGIVCQMCAQSADM
jgi:hypothetical protein